MSTEPLGNDSSIDAIIGRILMAPKTIQLLDL